MYTAPDNIYCYPGSIVLKNIPDLTSERELERFEIAMTSQRAEEPLPAGRFSVRHYCAIHRHLFQDVYVWAGRYRRVRMAKDDSMFCYPENIEAEMRGLFARLRSEACLKDRDAAAFAEGAASFLATLNAIHPFREGNGRTQLIFMAVLAHQAGHPLDMSRLNPGPFLQAMIASFQGDERPLASELLRMVR